MVVAVRFAKNQIEVFVVGAEKSAVLLLLVALEPERCERGLRQLERPRLSVLRALHSEARGRLFQGLANCQRARKQIEVRPLKGEQFSTPGAGRERQLHKSESPIASADLT